MDIAPLLKKLTIPPNERLTSVSVAEGEFIHNFVGTHGFSKTLETGLAYGTSAVCIMSAHSSTHTCIDPYQESFQNLGLKNLEKLGFRDRLDFHPDLSHNVLPKLLAEKRMFDFAFIDGGHLFDEVMVDFYFIDFLLEVNGFVLFHDAYLRGTQLVASFIRKNRGNFLNHATPGLNLILFQKTAPADNRTWDYFRDFYTWRGVISQFFVNKRIKNRLYRLKNIFKNTDQGIS